MLEKILQFKPGSAFYIIGGLLLFFAMALFTQYRMTGRVDPVKLVDRNREDQYFWDQNPQLEFVDIYPHTSLVVARDRQSKRTAMLDLGVVMNARVKLLPCVEAQGLDVDMFDSRSGDMVCFAIDKPDTGAGDRYTFGASFADKGKDRQVAQFYRALFAARGKRVFVVKDSSEGVTLEAQDEHDNSVARVAIRGSFDTASGFLAWNEDFH